MEKHRKGSRRIILASGSPRRIALLRQIGIEPEVMPSAIDENTVGYRSPVQRVLNLSQKKALEVAKRTPDAVIVAADTLVVLDGKHLGKPRDAAEARGMLSELSGREHLVYTGFTILHAPTRRFVSEYEVTRVKFRELESNEIDVYVKSGSCFDKAGAYGIQDDFGAVFVERIDGCYYNVMGFPLTKFYLTWRKFSQGLNDEKDKSAHRQGGS